MSFLSSAFNTSSKKLDLSGIAVQSSKDVIAKSRREREQRQQLRVRETAALKIQSVWRSWKARQLAKIATRKDWETDLKRYLTDKTLSYSHTHTQTCPLLPQNSEDITTSPNPFPSPAPKAWLLLSLLRRLLFFFDPWRVPQDVARIKLIAKLIHANVKLGLDTAKLSSKTMSDDTIPCTCAFADNIFSLAYVDANRHKGTDEDLEFLRSKVRHRLTTLKSSSGIATTTASATPYTASQVPYTASTAPTIALSLTQARLLTILNHTTRLCTLLLAHTHTHATHALTVHRNTPSYFTSPMARPLRARQRQQQRLATSSTSIARGGVTTTTNTAANTSTQTTQATVSPVGVGGLTSMLSELRKPARVLAERLCALRPQVCLVDHYTYDMSCF